jgi:hypothetical protein
MQKEHEKRHLKVVVRKLEAKKGPSSEKLKNSTLILLISLPTTLTGDNELEKLKCVAVDSSEDKMESSLPTV